MFCKGPSIMLEQDVSNCSLCELRFKCNQVVPGSGSHSGLMVLTTWPDSEEDLLGEALKSRSGLIVRKLLSEAGIHDAYITHLVKCWPRATKVKDIHIRTCSSWLTKELTLVQPKVVLALGREPIRFLLGLKKSYLLADYVGKIHQSTKVTAIAAWFGAEHLVQRGKKADEEFITFLRAIKEAFGV